MKQDRLTMIEKNQSQHILTESSLTNPDQPFNPTLHPALNQRLITLVGTFQNHQTFLLDNQPLNHQIGYHVIVPFLLHASQNIIFVNRGWIARGPSRTHLPNLKPIQEKITIKGWLHVPQYNFFINNKLESSHFPIRIQAIDLDLMSRLIKKPCMAVMVDLNKPPAIYLTPQKHFAYALQWLLLAFSFGIIYFIISTR